MGNGYVQVTTFDITEPGTQARCTVTLEDNLFGANTWHAVDSGVLPVDQGQWTKSPEATGPLTFQLLLDDGHGNVIVEFHGTGGGNSQGKAAIRVPCVFHVDPPNDPVGNHVWAV